MLLASAYVSIVIQIIVGIIDIYGLTIPVPLQYNILKDILKLELFVQVIEFCFYLWLVFNLTSKLNVTRYRYIDWMFSTPLMLISLTAFLNSSMYTYLYDFWKDNTSYLQTIMIGNLLMLLFGFLGELRILKTEHAVILGFVPFMLYFIHIYNNDYDKNDDVYQKGCFWFFFIVWSLYGIAAFLPYIYKNTMYNILDLFAKNFFGIFIVYIITLNKSK